jgi:tRNA-dihydrouridine synthase B
MIARGAVGNPFLFAEISAMIEKKEYKEPEISEKLGIAHEHALLAASDKGESVSVHELKKHIAAYVKDIRGAAAFRARIFACEDFPEMLGVLDEIRGSCIE